MADVYKKISEYNELAELDASGKMLVAQSDETYSVGADTMANYVKSTINVDSQPTAYSDNFVDSGHIYNALTKMGQYARDANDSRVTDKLLFARGIDTLKVPVTWPVDEYMDTYADAVPTQGSRRAVKSGGVYDAIEEVRALTETDDTLTVEDKPADAKAAGDRITALETTPPSYVYKWNSVDVLEKDNGTTRTNAGITFTKNTDGSWTISGTASSNSAFCNLISSANAIPPMIIPGRTYRFEMHGGTVPIKIYFYKGSSYTVVNAATDRSIKIPEDTTGMILRYQLKAGDVVNETVHYSFTAESDYAVNENWLDSVNGDLGSDETTAIDRSAEIVAMLNATGYCHLGPGVFYVSGNIDMPDGSMLCGCGDSTIVRLLSSVQSGYVVKMMRRCTISDICFDGSATDIAPTTDGGRDCIHFTANYDGSGGTATRTGHCMLNNLWIRDFSGSGIYCHNSSISVSQGIHALNLCIFRCFKGINIDYYSEFHKFMNCLTCSCYIACVNNGGNNVFTSCTFHGTNTGFMIDGTQPNGGHGTINGCTFCHIGNNNGTAIRITEEDAGFVIANCQFWYNAIEVTNSQGILFDGCEFGRGTSNDGNVCASITVDGGNLVMFSGCIFHLDTTRPPKITITNNNKVVFSGCYGTESGSLITA